MLDKVKHAYFWGGHLFVPCFSQLPGTRAAVCAEKHVNSHCLTSLIITGLFVAQQSLSHLINPNWVICCLFSSAPKDQGSGVCREACLQSLSRLQCSYLDLFLIHWPGTQKLQPGDARHKPNRLGSWADMEQLCQEGQTDSEAPGSLVIPWFLMPPKSESVQASVTVISDLWCL